MLPRINTVLFFTLGISQLHGQAVVFSNGQPAGESRNANVMRSPTGKTLTNPPAKWRPEEQYKYLHIQTYLYEPGPEIGAGVLGMMGDSAAFFIIAVMGNREPLDADEALTVLEMIHKSFSMPAFVQNAGDLKPNNTVQLLQLLQKTAVDQRVKERIAIESTFIKMIPSKIDRKPPPPNARRVTRLGDAMPHKEDFDKEDFEPKK